MDYGLKVIQIYAVYKRCTYFRYKATSRWEMKGWKNILHGNNKQKKSGIAILVSDKIDFRSKIIIFRSKIITRTLYIDKRPIHQEDITIIYTRNRTLM